MNKEFGNIESYKTHLKQINKQITEMIIIALNT